MTDIKAWTQYNTEVKEPYSIFRGEKNKGQHVLLKQ